MKKFAGSALLVISALGCNVTTPPAAAPPPTTPGTTLGNPDVTPTPVDTKLEETTPQDVAPKEKETEPAEPEKKTEQPNLPTR